MYDIEYEQEDDGRWHYLVVNEADEVARVSLSYGTLAAAQAGAEAYLLQLEQRTAKYPEIRVQLSRRDGNAFAIIGRVHAAMEKWKVPQEEIDAFTEEATSGNYDDLLQTCMRWVHVK